MNYVYVLDKEGKPLMPTTRYGKVRRMLKSGLAKCHGTTSTKPLDRILPGCEKPLEVKDIINTESRFNNRLRPEGWLTPTVTQLLRTHVNLLKRMCQILPITDVVMEVNRFAFMQLDQPNVKKCEIDFQHGPLFGTDGITEAVSIQQDGHCLFCGKQPIKHYHHIVPRRHRGSDTAENIAGLCVGCHRLVHTSQEASNRLKYKKDGINKKYGGISVLNQVIPFLFMEFEQMFPGHTYGTNGWNTKLFREKHSLAKNHSVDAYCIAASILPEPKVELPEETHEIVQYRRHDRARIKRQTERTYYLGKKVVCKNRHKRFEQKTDSLEEYTEKNPELLSKLTVKKSQRSYNDLTRVLPGAVILYQGKRYILSGRSSGGKQYRMLGCGNQNFTASKCTIVQQNTGLVYVS